MGKDINATNHFNKWFKGLKDVELKVLEGNAAYLSKITTNFEQFLVSKQAVV